MYTVVFIINNYYSSQQGENHKLSLVFCKYKGTRNTRSISLFNNIEMVLIYSLL